MRKFLRLTAMLLLLLVLSPVAFAQSGSPWAAPFPGLATNTPMTSEGEVLSSPQCFRVVNQAPYTITGSLYTNYYVNKNLESYVDRFPTSPVQALLANSDLQ